AAREIALVGPGTARVRVESIDGPDGPPGTIAYAVQAGAFQDSGKANDLRLALANRFENVYLAPFRTSDSFYYRARAGPFAARTEAASRARTLALGGVPAMIVEEVRP